MLGLDDEDAGCILDGVVGTKVLLVVAAFAGCGDVPALAGVVVGAGGFF